MDEKNYSLSRQRMRHVVTNAIDDKEVLEVFSEITLYLDKNQIFDFSMLLMSREAINLFKKAWTNRDELIKMDYSFNSIAGIQYIINMLRVHLDLERYKFRTTHGEYFDAVKPYFQKTMLDSHKNDITDKQIIEAFTLNISQILGAYVGECIITEIDKGYWRQPELTSQLSSLMLIKNGYETTQDINPIGKVWKNIILGDDENTFLGMSILLASWEKIEQSQKH